MPKRLNTDISPQNYQLSYDFDLDKFKYDLTETIKFTLNSDSNKLIFNGDGFKIRSAKLDNDHAPTKTTFDAKDQTIIFEFEEKILAGKHELELKIDGTIGEELHGLYRSRYTEGNTEKWLCVTQFEAVHAREALVCIDEPSAKAIFDICITAPASQTVLSNTDTAREITLASGRVRHEFLPTPIMSTYLLALVIGDLASIKANSKNKTLIRVYATKGKESQLAFALETAVRAIEFYEDYFDIPYPLSKLDMIAIPDFASGAMENWGLVTYRETALLLDPTQTSLGNRQRVAEVIAHELAHQWFGNLVTMAWWNDLWLNEGFASWMEVLAQDSLFPEWVVWDQFVSDHYAQALSLDGLVNSHPIEVEVEDARELDEIFDAVSYSKDASIINMLHSYLGADVFRDGLRNYLKQHAYSNTITKDLWSAMESSSGRPVVDLMLSWSSQAGYPIVSCRDDKLSQARFLNSGSPDKAHHQSWPVPISLLDNNLDKIDEPLLGESAELVSKNDWIKLNAGQAGFYRVKYDTNMLDRVLPSLQNHKLSVIDRFGIINDLFATTESGITTSAEALKLTLNLRDETSYVPSVALKSGFSDLVAIIESNELRDRMYNFGLWLNKPNLDRLGWDSTPEDDYFDKLLRPIVLQSAVRFNDTLVIEKAHELYEAGKIGVEISPDIRPAIYHAVARYGDMETFNELMKRYEQETVPQEKMRLLGGLCRFQQPDIIQKALDLSISDCVRSQDTIYVLAWSFHNRDARDQTWQFVQDHWKLFVERYGNGGHILDSIPQYTGMVFETEKSANEIEKFFAKNPHPSITRSVAQAVESIRIRAAWYKRDKVAIENFIKDWEATV